MSKKRVIVAAVGQKGVQCGVFSCSDGAKAGRYIPRQLVELVFTSKVDSWTHTRGGIVVSFHASRRSVRFLERFVERAEALRDGLPGLGIGIAEGWLDRRFDWFGLKHDTRIDPQAEKCALAAVQSDQTYRQMLDKLRAT